MDIATKLTDLVTDLHECRRAITYRGGAISPIAGFEEVAEKIASLPASTSIGTVVDEETSLLKMVPANSTKYCYLKSLGGMTYKCNNLIPYPYYNTTNTSKGITFTDNGDGTITLNGTAESNVGFTLQLKDNFTLPKGTYTLSGFPSGLDASCYLIVSVYNGSAWAGELLDNGNGITKDISNLTYTDCQVYLQIGAGTVCNNLVVKPMLNAGSTALPYEPYYEGLKDTKPITIKVSGANYLKPYYSAGYTQTKGNITYTVNDDGSFTINGTAIGTPAFVIANYLDLPVDDYYLQGNCVSGEWVGGVEVYTNYYQTSSYDKPSVKIASNKLPTWISVQVKNGTVVNNLTFKPMLSRKQVIPYTPYREPTTYPIPEALQGTGKGIEGASDTVDFENDKAITNIKTISLADVTGYALESVGGSVNQYITDDGVVAGMSYAVNDFNHSLRTKALCSHLPIHTDWTGKTYGVVLQNMPSGSHYIKVCIMAAEAGITTDDTYATIVGKIIAWLRDNSVILTYAIAEPASTDIDTSAFDPLIEVEPGGGIEFITDNGKASNSTIIYQTIL